MESGKCQHTFKGHTWYVTGCSISPNGKWIASSSSDNTSKIYDFEGNLFFDIGNIERSIIVNDTIYCFTVDSHTLVIGKIVLNS